MKLSDFDKVLALKAERNYIQNLKVCAAPPWVMKFSRYDVRPDLAAKMQPAIVSVLDSEIARIDADLAALGVTVEEGGAS